MKNCLVNSFIFLGEEVKESMVHDELSSNEDIPYSDILWPRKNFPIKDGIITKLTYSVFHGSFFAKVFIPGYMENQVFFLESKFGSDNQNIYFDMGSTAKILDNIINYHELRIFFAYCDHQLKLELMAKKDGQLNIFQIAHNEQLTEMFFLADPSLMFLVDLLETETENPHLDNIYNILKKGFLNPAREYIIKNKEEIVKLPKTIKNHLVAELLTKNQIVW